MKRHEWCEVFLGVKKPYLSLFPHIIFVPDKKYFDIIFQTIEKIPGIWGVPVPYDKNGNPTVAGADHWGLGVASDDDYNKLNRHGWFIPLQCDSNGFPIFPIGQNNISIDAWSYDVNQKVLFDVWNLGNYEIDKLILDCNCYDSTMDPLIQAFFEIKDDITSGIDYVLEKLSWCMFPIGPDEEYAVLVADKNNKKLIDQIIDKLENCNRKYLSI